MPSVDLTPRPTTYNGTKMRSRLEAAWAEQFDAWGWGWEYEPMAYASSNGQYLPDFRVWPPHGPYTIQVPFFIEVKPASFLGDNIEIDFVSWQAMQQKIRATEPHALLVIARGANEHGWVQLLTLRESKTHPIGFLRPCRCGDGYVSLYASAKSYCICCDSKVENISTSVVPSLYSTGFGEVIFNDEFNYELYRLWMPET